VTFTTVAAIIIIIIIKQDIREIRAHNRSSIMMIYCIVEFAYM